MSYPVGTWVVLLPHPLMRPKEMAGYDGYVTGLWEHGYVVRLPWMVKEVEAVAEIVTPAYPCTTEGCTYGSSALGEACSWHINL